MNRSFVADAMLGTLAKWLRILGYDTIFDPALNDHQLVRLARAENRVLLTRDQELARRPGVTVLLVTSEDLDGQMHQILTDLELVPDRSFSRCPICNEPLVTMNREMARTRVPPYVAQTHETFRTCPACRRVYWRGSHWRRMDRQLARLASSWTPADSAKSSETRSKEGG